MEKTSSKLYESPRSRWSLEVCVRSCLARILLGPSSCPAKFPTGSIVLCTTQWHPLLSSAVEESDTTWAPDGSRLLTLSQFPQASGGSLLLWLGTRFGSLPNMALKSLFFTLFLCSTQVHGSLGIPDVGLDYVTLQGRVNNNDHSWEYLVEFRRAALELEIQRPFPIVLIRSLHVRLGIPFARAGRFEHLRLYNDSLGVFKATNYGPTCPQKTAGSILSLNSSYSLALGEEGVAVGTAVGGVVDALFESIGVERDEDCLFINVQTPQNRYLLGC